VQPGRLFRKRYLNDRQVLPGDCMFGTDRLSRARVRVRVRT
jgi:hypothetical protein